MDRRLEAGGDAPRSASARSAFCRGSHACHCQILPPLSQTDFLIIFDAAVLAPMMGFISSSPIDLISAAFAIYFYFAKLIAGIDGGVLAASRFRDIKCRVSLMRV